MAQHSLHLHSSPTKCSIERFCGKDLLSTWMVQCSLPPSDSFPLVRHALLTQSRLCSQHSRGKKKLFAQYVKCVRDALLEAVTQYPQSFQSPGFSSFMQKYFDHDFLYARISNHIGMIGVGEIVREVFAGIEVEYERSFGPVSTDCHGTSSPFRRCYLYFMSKLTSQHVSHLLTLVPRQIDSYCATVRQHRLEYILPENVRANTPNLILRKLQQSQSNIPRTRCCPNCL